MTSASVSEFNANVGEFITAAEAAPVEITDANKSAVLVSRDFFERALDALEDHADIASAREARKEPTRVSHAELLEELEL